MRLHYYRNKEGIELPKSAEILSTGNKRIKSYIKCDGTVKKHCIKCNTFKSTWDFGWDKYTWDGLSQYCKACRKELQNARNDRS